MRNFIIFWGYAAEVVLSMLVLILFCTIWNPIDVAEFIDKTAIDFATLFCAVCLAAMFAFFWTLYSKVDTEFYKWFSEIGALSVYTKAYIYSIFVELIATIILILVKSYPSTILSLIGAFMLVLSFINVVTFMKSTYDLIKIQTLYNIKKSQQAVAPDSFVR